MVTCNFEMGNGGFRRRHRVTCHAGYNTIGVTLKGWDSSASLPPPRDGAYPRPWAQSCVQTHKTSFSLGWCSEVSVDASMKSKSQSFLLFPENCFCLFRKNCFSVAQQVLYFCSHFTSSNKVLLLSTEIRFLPSLNFFIKLLTFSTASPSHQLTGLLWSFFFFFFSSSSRFWTVHLNRVWFASIFLQSLLFYLLKKQKAYMQLRRVHLAKMFAMVCFFFTSVHKHVNISEWLKSISSCGFLWKYFCHSTAV